MTLPTDKKARKATPIATGVIDYFPLALAEVARVSHAGNAQHNPGKPLHWDRSKSSDEADALMRHFVERGTIDEDGQRHSAKVAWRALALLQKELEAEKPSKTRADYFFEAGRYDALRGIRGGPCFGASWNRENYEAGCASVAEEQHGSVKPGNDIPASFRG